MALSSSLISKFVKITNDTDTSESSLSNKLQGTVVQYSNKIYVQLDGSDQLTPVTTSTGLSVGDRVIVEIADHSALVTTNITSPSASKTTTDVISSDVDSLQKFEILATEIIYANQANIKTIVADNVTVKDRLTATEADITKLQAADVTITGTLTAAQAKIDNLESTTLKAEVAEITYAKISDLEATNADIHNLKADYIDAIVANIESLIATNATITGRLEAAEGVIDNLESTYATITNLNAVTANIDTLNANVANINTVLSGNIGTGSLQTIHLTADNVVIDDATITDAMISSLSAGKITSGSIYTSLITLQTAEDDDSLYITNSLIQMRDNDGTTRIQLGLDGEGNYNYYVFGTDGSIIFDALGVYGEGIHEGVVINDHIQSKSDGYSGISGEKLDIDSVIVSINEDGSETINGSSVTINGETLDYRLTQVNNMIGEALSNYTSYYCLWNSATEAPPFPDNTGNGAYTDLGLTDTCSTDSTGMWSTTYTYPSGDYESWYTWRIYALETTDGTTTFGEPELITGDKVARDSVTTLNTQFTIVQGNVKSLIEYTDITKWESGNKTIYTAYSEMNQTLTDFTSTISEVQLKVDGFAVGGRNLILDTQKMENWYKNGSNTSIIMGDDGFAIMNFATKDEASWVKFSNQKVGYMFPYTEIRNKTVTISFEMRSDDYDGPITPYVELSLSSGENDTSRQKYYPISNYMDQQTITSEWQKISYTLKITDDIYTGGTGTVTEDCYVFVEVYHYIAAGAQYRKVKAEIGSVATDWSPAPEDMVDSYTLSSTVTNINQTTSNILMQVKSVETELINLEIGGRNLILNSTWNYDLDDWTKWSANSGATWTVEEGTGINGTNALTIERTEYTTATSTGVYSVPTVETISAGDVYTLSFWMKINSVPGGNIRVFLRTYPTGTTTIDDQLYTTITTGAETTDWVYHSVTGTFEEARDVNVVYILLNNTGSITVSNVKLEKGNKPTDWTPAPEDVGNNYSTTTQMNAAIDLKAYSITSTVSETIAAIDIGGTNLQQNSDFAIPLGSDSHWTRTNTSYLNIDETELFEGINSVKFERSDLTADSNVGFGTTIGDIEAQPDTDYTISAYFKATTVPDGTQPALIIMFYDDTGTWISQEYIRMSDLSESWKRYYVTATSPENTAGIRFYWRTYRNGVIYMAKPKVEKGNKPTDWSLSPSEVPTSTYMATQIEQTANSISMDVQNVQEGLSSRLSLLENNISTMVTDENGDSKMTQTPTGWKFDLSSISNDINTAINKADSASSAITSAQGTIEQLSTQLTNLTAYVNITTDSDGDPLLELGKTDSDFKVQITNTSLDFMEGSTAIAYVSNQKIYIEEAVVKEGLQIGEGSGFVWKRRSNGNLGLSWVSA